MRRVGPKPSPQPRSPCLCCCRSGCHPRRGSAVVFRTTIANQLRVSIETHTGSPIDRLNMLHIPKPSHPTRQPKPSSARWKKKYSALRPQSDSPESVDSKNPHHENESAASIKSQQIVYCRTTTRAAASTRSTTSARRLYKSSSPPDTGSGTETVCRGYGSAAP